MHQPAIETETIHKIVVLDDDPTGTQTVHDVDVWTRWNVEDLLAALASDDPAFYLLTNSRALPSREAAALNRTIAGNLATAWRSLQADAPEYRNAHLHVISRGDSTLRGHYPVETDALMQTLAAALDWRFDGLVLAPFFAEGGRITIDDVHYVRDEHGLQPVADTEFARDHAFGFRSSNLKAWVEEKTAGRIRAEQVASLSLPQLRTQSTGQLVEQLLALSAPVLIVNAETYDDIRVACTALRQAAARGKRYLYRTAASFVREFAQIPARDLLTPAELVPTDPDARVHGGLLIVGSYVQKTTQQLNHLLSHRDVRAYELDVAGVLASPGEREHALQAILQQLEPRLRAGEDCVVYTSRRLATQPGEAGLKVGEQISQAMVELVRRLQVAPRFLIAKGGITSSDTATKGLGIVRARVLGQLLPGVPVWRPGEQTKFPGIPYVVFPGNVGGVDALTTAFARLSGSGG